MPKNILSSQWLDGNDSITSPGAFTNAAVADFFDDAGTDRAVVVQYVGGNAQVYVDANHDGNLTAAGDLVIRVNDCGQRDDGERLRVRLSGARAALAVHESHAYDNDKRYAVARASLLSTAIERVKARS